MKDHSVKITFFSDWLCSSPRTSSKSRKSGMRKKGICDIVLDHAKDRIGMSDLGLRHTAESLLALELIRSAERR
jgi:hypothetical protein